MELPQNKPLKFAILSAASTGVLLASSGCASKNTAPDPNADPLTQKVDGARIKTLFWTESDGTPLIAEEEVIDKKAQAAINAMAPKTVIEQRKIQVPNMVQVRNPKYDQCRDCGIKEFDDVQKGFRTLVVSLEVPAAPPASAPTKTQRGRIVGGGLVVDQSWVTPEAYIALEHNTIEQDLHKVKTKMHLSDSALKVVSLAIRDMLQGVGSLGELVFAFRWEQQKPDTNIDSTYVEGSKQEQGQGQGQEICNDTDIDIDIEKPPGRRPPGHKPHKPGQPCKPGKGGESCNP